jgi:hypothetical protein
MAPLESKMFFLARCIRSLILLLAITTLSSKESQGSDVLDSSSLEDLLLLVLSIFLPSAATTLKITRYPRRPRRTLDYFNTSMSVL